MIVERRRKTTVDADFPYAEDIARLRLLYRLQAGAGDLLVIGAAQMASELARDWPGKCRLAGSWRSVGVTEGPFDVVALPGWSAGAVHDPATRDELRRVHDLLRPGGWVIGHAEQACTLRRMLGGRGWWAALRPDRFVGRPTGCVAALSTAGFEAPSVWYVRPNIAAPMGLIPTDPAAARAEFLRSVRATRGHYSMFGYVPRLLLARLGLGGLQQGQLFFWARRPC